MTLEADLTAELARVEDVSALLAKDIDINNGNCIIHYLQDEIDLNTAVERTIERLGEHISAYVAGATDFMEFIRDYYNGEPVWPSEMEYLLDEFFERFGGVQDET